MFDGPMAHGSFTRAARTAGRGCAPCGRRPGTAVGEGQRAKRAAPVPESRDHDHTLGGVGGSAAHPTLPESHVTTRPHEAHFPKGAPRMSLQATMMSNEAKAHHGRRAS